MLGPIALTYQWFILQTNVEKVVLTSTGHQSKVLANFTLRFYSFRIYWVHFKMSYLSKMYSISAHIFELRRKFESNISEKKIKPIFVVQHDRCQSGNSDQRYDTFNDIDFADRILADILLEFEQYHRK